MFTLPNNVNHLIIKHIQKYSSITTTKPYLLNHYYTCVDIESNGLIKLFIDYKDYISELNKKTLFIKDINDNTYCDYYNDKNGSSLYHLDELDIFEIIKNIEYRI